VIKLIIVMFIVRVPASDGFLLGTFFDPDDESNMFI
jgi:hypothetical protein